MLAIGGCSVLFKLCTSCMSWLAVLWLPSRLCEVAQASKKNKQTKKNKPWLVWCLLFMASKCCIDWLCVMHMHDYGFTRDNCLQLTNRKLKVQLCDSGPDSSASECPAHSTLLIWGRLSTKELLPCMPVCHPTLNTIAAPDHALALLH